MRSKKGWLPIAFFGILAAVVIWKIDENPFYTLLELDYLTIGLLLFATTAIFALLGEQINLMLAAFGVRVTRTESFEVSLANTFLNYLPAKAGTIARGAYFFRVWALPVTSYIALTAAIQLLSVFIAASVGIAAACWLVITRSIYSLLPALSVLSLTLLVVLLTAMLARPLSARLITIRFARTLANIAYGADIWRRHPKTGIGIAMVNSFLFVAFAWRLWLSFSATDVHLGLPEVLLLQACVGASVAFSVLPGNLGLKEGVIVGIAWSLGVEPEYSIAAALIDRSAALMVVFAVGPWVSKRLTARATNGDNT